MLRGRLGHRLAALAVVCLALSACSGTGGGNDGGTGGAAAGTSGGGRGGAGSGDAGTTGNGGGGAGGGSGTTGNGGRGCEGNGLEILCGNTVCSPQQICMATPCTQPAPPCFTVADGGACPVGTTVVAQCGSGPGCQAPACWETPGPRCVTPCAD